jgi:PAS domain S-box-containing protein
MTDEFQIADGAPSGPVMEAHGWARLAEQIAGLGYWRLEVATRAIIWSEGLFRIYGLPVGDLPDLDAAMAAIHPDDSAQANALLQQAMDEGVDYSSKVRLRRADGSWRILINRSTCQRDEAGAVAAVFGAVMDVTEMELANEALRASEARYRVLAENGNDLIVQTDLGGRVTYISPSVLSATGYAPEELIGGELTDLIHADDRSALRTAVVHAYQHPQDAAACVQYRVSHKDGREVWLEARPSPLIDAASGRVIGVTDVVRVVTERKNLEMELRAKCEEARPPPWPRPSSSPT